MLPSQKPSGGSYRPYSRRDFLKWSAAGLAAIPLAGAGRLAWAEDQLKHPLWLSPYDLATQRELYCRRLVAPFMQGNDAAKWPLLKEVIKEVGDWIEPVLEAPKIAKIVSDMMPLGDKLLPKYDAMVADCADILQIPKPKTVIIDQDRVQPGYPHIYVVEMRDDNTLVISSKYLALYADTQDELRFLVGRELARSKCEYAKLGRAGFAIQSLLQSIPPAGLVGAVTAILCPIHLGYFLAWCREVEISVDRGGLLCCQDRKLAERALLRQHCNMDQATIEKYGGTFDPDSIIKAFEFWENKPFVDFLRKIKGMALSCPYVDERIAALRVWDSSGVPDRILGRKTSKDESLHFEVAKLRVTDVADEDTDVYVVARDMEQELFKTPTASKVRSVTWIDIGSTYAWEDGKPMFFDIWSSGVLSDSLLGTFVIYPQRPEQKGDVLFKTTIEWSVHERKSITRVGIGQVRGRFLSS